MKQLSKAKANAKACPRCGKKTRWARTQATDRTIRIEEAKQAVPGFDGWPENGMELIDGADLAITSEAVDGKMREVVRDTARGKVPVVCYVRPGTGTHTEHVCG